MEIPCYELFAKRVDEFQRDGSLSSCMAQLLAANAQGYSDSASILRAFQRSPSGDCLCTRCENILVKGQTITLPALDDMPSYSAVITDVYEDVICFMREDNVYGEIDREMLE